MRRLILLALPVLAAFSLLAAACSGSNGGDETGVRLTLRSVAGRTATLKVEVADDQAERQVGLSNRESLAPEAGMLFVIEGRGPGFWMKDTSIPLSVAFIGECGQIVALADMEPFSLQVHNTERPYRFGLEVNRGWFAAHGIGAGDTVVIPEAYWQPGCP